MVAKVLRAAKDHEGGQADLDLQDQLELDLLDPRVAMAGLDTQEFVATEVQKDPLELMEHLELMGLRAILVTLDPQERKDPMVQRDHLDQLDLMDHREGLVKRDLMDYKVYLVTKEVLVIPEQLEQMELQELRDLMAKRVHVVILELLEPLVLLVMLEQLALKVILVTKAYLASLEHLVNQDPEELQDSKDLLVHLEQQEGEDQLVM